MSSSGLLILICRAVIHGMIRKEQGKIINIVGEFPAYLAHGPDVSHYFLATWALHHLGVHVAEELKPFNIQVNNINPGVMETESVKSLWPETEGKQVSMEDWGEFLIFFMTSQSDQVTGQSVRIQHVLEGAA